MSLWVVRLLVLPAHHIQDVILHLRTHNILRFGAFGKVTWQSRGTILVNGCGDVIWIGRNRRRPEELLAPIGQGIVLFDTHPLEEALEVENLSLSARNCLGDGLRLNFGEGYLADRTVLLTNVEMKAEAVLEELLETIVMRHHGL